MSRLWAVSRFFNTDVYVVPCAFRIFGARIGASWVLEFKRTTHQVDPGADAHLLAGLHHLQCLVKQHFAGKGVVDDFDHSVCKGKPPPRGVFLHADTATEGELKDDATTKRIADIVIPKREVALRVAMVSVWSGRVGTRSGRIGGHRLPACLLGLAISPLPSG